MSGKSSYRYFDTPEGEDIFKKLWFVLKPAGITAITFSTLDVMAYSRPKGYLQTLGRCIYVSAPFIGAATAFVIVTNLAVNIRNKDDKLNWVVGAIAAGSTIGVWKRSTPAGCFTSLAFVIGALVQKHSLQEGWQLIPRQFNTAYSGVFAAKHDYTLMKERPRGWAVAPPEDK